MACPNGHTIAQLDWTGGLWGPKSCNPPCPANSTPSTSTTCTCNTDFKPDLSATSCVPEQYTISLVGLGGEVMPTKTLTTAYAEATPIVAGTSRSGVQVNLKLEVVPEEDGYNHAVGQHIAPHEGSLAPAGRATTLTGTTDAEGKFPFVFYAPEAGGTHTITATCANNKCTNQDTGTITVPGCPVPPLSAPPFTDPVATGFENGNRWRPDLLTANYQSKLACVEAAIDAATGVSQSYTGTSAYRPTQYQQHLLEIVKKDVKLKPTYILAHPECQALRNKVTGEMKGHGLKYDQDVAEPGKSRHESGTAFDLTPHGLSDAQLAPIYAGCGVTHTAVPSEPWHVQ